jgi:predicted transcriptional regulator
VKQRSTLAIISLILDSTSRRKEGVTKSRIMQEVMLTYERTNRYCDMMVKKGLLTYAQGSRTYSLTPKGVEVLQSSKEIFGYLDNVKSIVDKYRIYDESTIDDIHNVNYYYPAQQ